MPDDMIPPPFVPGMKWWLCSYERDGDRYSIAIPAKSADEAEAVLLAQFGTGTVDGELAGSMAVDDETARAIRRNLEDP